MPDIFDEVEADLRAERARRFFTRYAGAGVGLLVLIVLAVGGWEAWQYYRARDLLRLSDSYLAAQRLADATPPDRAAAIDAFGRIAAGSASGYRALATLREAALKADGGDLAGASALWDQVAGTGAVDPLLRDLASLLWVMHHVDSSEPAQVEARLQSLGAADNPFHGLAAEMMALVEIRAGRPDAARATLKQLAADVTAPAGVRGRANGLLQQLGG
ncbi:MAG: tetratricopeptide repeat protein [Acetobacteraceae bacterium]|nr:tetratricopeptide repeat protein [Acetobacteraceae bacterium]